MKNGQQTLESMSQAQWYNQWTLKKFAEFLHGDILEIGCGIGNFTNELIRYGKVWAIDIDQDYVTKTKQKVDGKAEIGLGDIEKGRYFFSGRKFDSIVCLNVLEHLKDDNSALQNLFALLRPGGKVILLVPSHQFLYGEIDKSLDHFRRYDKAKINLRLKDVGFKVIKSRRLNFLGALGWFIAGKILKQVIVQEGNIKIFNLIAPFVLKTEDLIEPPVGISILVIAKKI